jgi:hypothetical protein
MMSDTSYGQRLRQYLRELQDMRKAKLYLAADAIGSNANALGNILRRERESWRGMVTEERRRRVTEALSKYPEISRTQLAEIAGVERWRERT